ncbi:RpiR family transcriptional regulator [Spirochaetia bacterium]|nr:RpiR family transcriptional regulator [Spirochaetia bacterium]GHV10033.1 RpiR family transcriptional regulator [Spirochaetia bacterium]
MESALFAIRQYLSIFPAAEGKVAEYVLNEPRLVLHYNITELARQCGVSQAAIVRFCRRIGTEGFSDFKLRLSHDVFRTSDDRFLPDLELESDMDPALVVKGVFGSIQRSMARLESLNDITLLSRSVEIIRAARTTYIFGLGASGLVAQDLYQKLIRIGIPCWYSPDVDLQITAACNLLPEDAVCIISYSGETPAMVTAAEWTGKKGAPIITLTMETENTLRKSADIALLVPSLERIYRSGATVSRLNQLAVIDMIYSLLISKNLNAAITALEQTMAATHYQKNS